MFQSYLPRELWSPDWQTEVEKWLVDHIREPFLRKEIYLDWSAYFNIPFTREMSVNVKAGEYP